MAVFGIPSDKTSHSTAHDNTADSQKVHSESPMTDKSFNAQLGKPTSNTADTHLPKLDLNHAGPPDVNHGLPKETTDTFSPAGRSQTMKFGDGTTVTKNTPGAAEVTKDASGNIIGSKFTSANNETTNTWRDATGTHTNTLNKDGVQTYKADWDNGGGVKTSTFDPTARTTTDTSSPGKGSDKPYTSSTTDANGKVMSGNSIASDKNGITTRSQDAAGNQTTSFKPSDANTTTGASTETKNASGQTTDKQVWSPDGGTRTQVSQTNDGGKSSTTYGKDGNITDYQRWGADNSYSHSGTAPDGKHYSEQLDGKGNLTSYRTSDGQGNNTHSGTRPDGSTVNESQDSKGNYQSTGKNADGSFYSNSHDAQGNSDKQTWKGAEHTQEGTSKNGDRYSRVDNGNTSQFTDRTGTANFTYNKDGSTTKDFTPANGAAGGKYNMTTNSDGSGKITNSNGITSWGGKDGGWGYNSADGNTHMTVGRDGSGLYSDGQYTRSWDSSGKGFTQNRQTGEIHADAAPAPTTQKTDATAAPAGSGSAAKPAAG